VLNKSKLLVVFGEQLLYGYVMNKPTIMICLQCGSTQRNETGCKVTNPAAVTLADEVQKTLSTEHPELAKRLDVKLVRCLVQCDEPIAWGLRANDLYNYVFSNGDVASEIVALAARWIDEDRKGCMPARTLPPKLRKNLRGRLPPFPENGEII